jgi:hypothetical protein
MLAIAERPPCRRGRKRSIQFGKMVKAIYEFGNWRIFLLSKSVSKRQTNNLLHSFMREIFLNVLGEKLLTELFRRNGFAKNRIWLSEAKARVLVVAGFLAKVR